MGAVFTNPPVRGPDQSDEEYRALLDQHRDDMLRMAEEYEMSMLPWIGLGYVAVPAFIIALIVWLTGGF